MNILAGIFLALYLFSVGHAACPCTVNSGLLHCANGGINNFPEDISGCNLNANEISSIEIQFQPIQKIKANAFTQFPILSRLSILSNENLDTIDRHAFNGLTLLKSLDLHSNKLQSIPQGTFNELIHLENLDISSNPMEESYVSNAWYFCTGLEAPSYPLQLKTDLPVSKSLLPEPKSTYYCSWRRYLDETPTVEDVCTFDGLTYTCDANKVQFIACQLEVKEFDDVIFEFPPDTSPVKVEDFHEGESNAFFQEFNYNGNDINAAKLLSTMKLYGTKFDLNTLTKYTSTRTQEVTIHADTVFQSGPITEPLNYKLNIRARVVSITHPIPMKISKEDMFKFTESPNDHPVEPFALKEDTIKMTSSLTMRVRQLGNINILDEYIGDVIRAGEKCQPSSINITEYLGETADWFDTTAINLLYVCARTLLTTRNNDNLILDMSNFMLNFTYDKKVVQNDRAFMASREFKDILQLLGRPNVHLVPLYTVPEIATLSKLMHDRFQDYRTNEIAIENEISRANARLEDMNIYFQTVEQQQELYFQQELAQLEEIFQFIDNSWHWSFEHREAIQKLINENLESILNSLFEMQNQEYQEMLQEAEQSVEHYQDVVDNYQSQVNRRLFEAKELMKVINDLETVLDEKTQEMDTNLDIWERNAHKWIDRQRAKAIFGIFKGILTMGIGFAIGVVDPEAILDAIEIAHEGLVEIKEVMEELQELQETLSELEDLIDEITEGEIGDIALNLTTDFKNALENAVEMKGLGYKFDDMKTLAQIKVAEFNEMTDHEVDGTTDVMVSCCGVADTGNRLIEEVANFADKMLILAERLDDLALAKQDLERAIAQVDYVKDMIVQLQEMHDKYLADMDAARKAYEDKVKELEEAYETASMEIKEKFKHEILDRFNDFKDQFTQRRREFNLKLSRLVESIQIKRVGLKDATMTQRSMIFPLFYDACDTMYYFSFKVCTELDVPMMSAPFNDILQSLNDIQWEYLTAEANVPCCPQNFGQGPDSPETLIISDQDDFTFADFPVTSLKTNKKALINIIEQDKTHRLNDFWRVRIDRVRLVLLQEDGSLVPSPGTTLGYAIQVKITYPSTFIDRDESKQNHTFIGMDYACNADYYVKNGEADFISECTVAAEFSDRNYKSSADGFYTFEITNADDIDMSKIHQLRLEFGGTYISYNFAEEQPIGMNGTYNMIPLY